MSSIPYPNGVPVPKQTTKPSEVKRIMTRLRIVEKETQLNNTKNQGHNQHHTTKPTPKKAKRKPMQVNQVQKVSGLQQFITMNPTLNSELAGFGTRAQQPPLKSNLLSLCLPPTDNQKKSITTTHHWNKKELSPRSLTPIQCYLN